MRVPMGVPMRVPMRVLVISPYSLSFAGGVQGQVLGLARSLRALGLDARVLAPSDGPPPEPGITTVGPSTRFDSNGSVAPIASGKAVARRTLEALRVFRPDVLHLHEPLVPGSNHATLLGADVPAVGTFHASYSLGANRWYQLFRRPARRLLDRVTVRTAVSEGARRMAEEAFGGTYEVLPNGVEVDRFAGADPWPVDRPVIFFVGRHEPRKGLAVLLDAFAGLERDAVLWIAGDGPQTDELRARDVPGVEWLGGISEREKAARLRAATVACFPSVGSESFGIVLLEALAAGAPVVASDISGYRNVARAGREALLFEAGNGGALRDTLRSVLDDPGRRQALVAAGRERAAEFSMTRLAERYVALYKAAVGARPLR
jgi:phosphatidylinositol alpha-mannosyltransferase